MTESKSYHHQLPKLPNKSIIMMSSIPRILSILTPIIYTNLIYHPFHQKSPMVPIVAQGFTQGNPSTELNAGGQLFAAPFHHGRRRRSRSHDLHLGRSPWLPWSTTDPSIRGVAFRNDGFEGRWNPAVLKKTPRGTENQRIPYVAPKIKRC